MKQKSSLKKLLLSSTILMSIVACTKEKQSITSETAFKNDITAKTLLSSNKSIFEPFFSKEIEIPAAISIPNADKYDCVVKVVGKGYQIYQVQETTPGSGVYQWVFIAPEANLYNKESIKVGAHAAGPIWRDLSGNTIGAVKEASVSSPDAVHNIPWLRLKVNIPTLAGMFSQALYIQRLATVGGVAPLTAATKDNIGQQVKVPYLALYAFYKAKTL